MNDEEVRTRLRWGASSQVFVASVAALSAMYALIKVLAVRDPESNVGILQTFPVALGAFFVLGVFVGVRTSGASGRLAPYFAVYLGLAGGVLLWTGLEEMVFRRFGDYLIYQSHDLFPIEIVLWCVNCYGTIGAGGIHRSQGARAHAIRSASGLMNELCRSGPRRPILSCVPSTTRLRPGYSRADGLRTSFDLTSVCCCRLRT
jgi:hypothetical protein